jgi:hypothetical protein
MVFLISGTIPAQTKNSAKKQLDKGNKSYVPLLDKKEIEKWLNYLASDSMKGRKNGSPEMKQAAIWIAEEFKSNNLRMFAGNEGYFQHYFIKRGKDSIPESNIIGYIEGSDPELKKEYIVVSAHFDHLGIGKPVNADSIYNGANDNASGICGLMGIAKTFNLMKDKPARTIVFAAFSGEEMSASGSKNFVRHINFPVESIYLNINIEMIGECAKLGKNKYSITGSGYSNLKGMLVEYDKNSDWKLIDTMKSLDNLFFKADNVAFANVKRTESTVFGVPAHTFITWNGEESLHKPFDEVKNIDSQNMTNFIQYLSGLTLYLSDCKESIDWTDSRIKRIHNE